MWFKNNGVFVPELEKHDIFVIYEDLEIIASLIIHKQNAHKDELVKLFFDRTQSDK